MSQSRLSASPFVLSLSLCALAPTAAAQPAAEPTLALAFDATSVTIGGAPAGGRVALVGISRERDAFLSRLVRFDEVVSADAEGDARFELPDGQEVSPRSVWAAVDLATGDHAIAAPPGGEVHRVELPARGLGANRRFLDGDGQLLDVLVIRPAAGPEGAEAAGVWGLRAGDGGETDRDGEANARISLSFTDLIALADSGPPPESLRPKDVLLGVDPFSMAIYAVQVADGPEGE